jgi:hypothetical protein
MHGSSQSLRARRCIVRTPAVDALPVRADHSKHTTVFKWPTRNALRIASAVPYQILRTLGPKMKTPAGAGPTGASVEEVMKQHRDLLPKIMLILRIRVKIIIIRR